MMDLMVLLSWRVGIQFGGVAQLGEHLLCKQGVVGSIPTSSTKHFDHSIGCSLLPTSQTQAAVETSTGRFGLSRQWQVAL